MIAAIYARKSTDQIGVADDQKSVARQIEHARSYASRKGWTVVDAHVYVDDGISGAEFANRPGYLRLMNALKPRAPFQILIMSEVSRLGREQIETAYTLKQLSIAGVRCFSYLEDRELLMESATDKFLLSAVNFAAEIEREKGRQRTYDAMVRKAKVGHVTGGFCFGYRNVRMAAGHVERVIDEPEAAIVRRIFHLSATGHGVKAITKQLNEERAPSPRPRRGRPQSWTPSSVRAMLYRPLYRGEIVYAQTAKRDRWGRQKTRDRSPDEWIRCPAPALRIVSEAEWSAAHARLDAVHALYLKGTKGQSFGRPPLGDASKYLLTNLALCGCCGGSLRVRSRQQTARHRKHFYGCAGYHERGTTVCRNKADVPMRVADAEVIAALLDEVLNDSVLTEAVDVAIGLLQGEGALGRFTQIETTLETLERECANYLTAIAAGGDIPGLVAALRTREAQRAALVAERTTILGQRPLPAARRQRLRDDLLALADAWRMVLIEDPPHARPIVASLLLGRVTITPTAPGRWTLTGEGTLTKLFARELAFPLVWCARQDSNLWPTAPEAVALSS